MEPGRSDKILIREVADGQRDALAGLYDRHAEELMAVGMKYLDETSVVEEVIHELFLDVWSSAHSYDRERGTVRTWLMVQMRSRALDKRRYEGRRQHSDIDEAVEAEPLEADEDPSRAAQHEWVREMVAELPERLRDVLVCTYFFEMTGPETAEELDLPVGTVRSRLAAARRELRNRVRSEEL